MFYQLSPAGNPIRTHPVAAADAVDWTGFAPYRPHFYQSGTAALAAALLAAKRLKPVADPAVIVPAYGCPDIVSAVIHAGARPVAVDLEADRPWMDITAVEAACGDDTIALVAAAFCGIQERIGRLRDVAGRVGAVVIEDSAQLFPAADETGIWDADLVVLSFGRGKPVSLLGGGAVLRRAAIPDDSLPAGHTAAGQGPLARLGLRAGLHLYNMLLSPRRYWLLRCLPWLHLGETRYRPLPSIQQIDPFRRSLLTANIAHYQAAPLTAQERIREALAGACPGLVDLPALCGVGRTRRLLRYPLLVEARARDAILDRLTRAGLGASALYPAPLPGLPGMAAAIGHGGDYRNAAAFAARLITLPTHEGVRASDVDRMQRILAKGGWNRDDR